MNRVLLGKILATIATAAVDAGVVATDPKGAIANSTELSEIIGGFLSIWLDHPASGVPQQAAPIKVGA